MRNLSPNVFTLLKLHSRNVTEEEHKAARTAISSWMAQVCSDMPLTDANNFTEYQHQQGLSVTITEQGTSNATPSSSLNRDKGKETVQPKGPIIPLPSCKSEYCSFSRNNSHTSVLPAPG